MAPQSEAMLPAAPQKRYRPGLHPRRRQRRQAEPVVEEEISSASEDDGIDSGIDSDGIESESDDDELYSQGQSAPTPLPASGSTTAGALTTVQVDKGGVVVTTLPGASVDADPPLNVGVPAATITEPAATTSETTITASPTKSATAEADKEFDHEHDHEGHREEVKKGDDTGRHIMIGAGSIGAFIGVCILGWLFWRMTRSRRKGRNGGDGSPWSRLFPGGRPGVSHRAQIGKVLGRIPWVKTQPWALRWQTRGDDDTVPITREKPDRSSDPGGYFAPNEQDAASTARSVSLQRVVVPPLDTNFSFNPAAQTVSPNSSHTATPLSAATSVPNAAVVASHHQPQASFSSLDNQGGTWVYVSPANPQAQRNHRASELSSLSSGFGDGEIILPPAYRRTPSDTTVTPRAPAPTRTRTSVGNASSNRDTMYTATSDDQPARFRTVSSWVDQQKGRIHRAQQRVKDGVVVVPGGEEGAPPVPGVPAGAGENGLPPEPVFNMMMPDGEVPRKVEER